MTDNVHEDSSGNKAGDGDGFAVTADPGMKEKVLRGVQRLGKVPGLNNTVPVVLSWSEVGSLSEKQAIMQQFPSLRHRIFTLLDSRRYSMYFNRYKAFMQVPAYEHQHGIQFNWVVHARLDAVWTEPVLPVHFWSSLGPTVNHRYGKFSRPSARKPKLTSTGSSSDMKLKIWVVDTWFDDVPDTFALIPRDYAKQFFNFDTLSEDNVVCLGGGNVNITKARSPRDLMKLNFTLAECDAIGNLVCKHDDQGGSEVIMKNRLRHHKITLGRGNLGYQTFPTAIVRPNLDNMCFYLETTRLIGWVWSAQYGNAATYPACTIYLAFYRQFRDDIAKSIMDGRGENTAKIYPPLLTDGLDGAEGVKPFTAACYLGVDGEYSGPNCLLDRLQTDWNFMPFRLHKHRQCVSFGGAPSSGIQLRPCIAHETVGKDYNVTYSPLQLLHLVPLLRTAQQLQVQGVDDRGIMCLSSVPIAGSDSRNLVLKRCFNDKLINVGHDPNQKINVEVLTQMFLVKLIPVDPFERDESSSQFVVGRALHPQSLLPPSVIISVAQVERREDVGLLTNWYHAPFTRQREASGHTASYPPSLRCISINPPGDGDRPEHERSELLDGTVTMESCNAHDYNQKIVIERTSTVAWVKFLRKKLETDHYGSMK